MVLALVSAQCERAHTRLEFCGTDCRCTFMTFSLVNQCILAALSTGHLRFTAKQFWRNRCIQVIYIARRAKCLSDDFGRNYMCCSSWVAAKIKEVFALCSLSVSVNVPLRRRAESYLDDELRGFAERRDGRVHEARCRVRCVRHQERLPLHTTVNYKTTIPP